MTSSSLRRKIAVVLVGAFLVIPWVSAAEPRGRADLGGPGAVWDLLTCLWGSLTAVWSDIGCSIDPYGGGCPGGTGSSETPDEGCSVDPDGHCVTGAESGPPITPDEGCSADPYGRCNSGS
jgi:hypothetical protein